MFCICCLIQDRFSYIARVLVEQLVAATKLKDWHVAQTALVHRLHLKFDLHERVGRLVEVGVGESPTDGIQVASRHNIRLASQAYVACRVGLFHFSVQFQNGQIVLKRALVKIRILSKWILFFKT